MLSIKKLTIGTLDKTIIDNVTLSIAGGEIHALMGPNGSGKSTLSLALAGHPSYLIKSGSSITLDGQNILPLSAHERTEHGLFLTFQQPIAIPGLSVQQLLKVMADHLHQQPSIPVNTLRLQMVKYAQLLHIRPEFLTRSIHENFSGGEQKRLEMLQLLIAQPKIAILDEIDSGLDIDAIKVIAKAVEYARTTFHTSFLIITHYRRILDHIKPDHVHIMVKGRLIKSGGKELIDSIEKNGYQQFN